MYLTNKNINLVKQNDSEFVSLKYLDVHGRLCQLDFLAKNMVADFDNKGLKLREDLHLIPIDGKAFIDPFRALPTTSFLCNNIAKGSDIRGYASKILFDYDITSSVALELTFWILNEHNSVSDQESCLADPFDIYSNLRSDILQHLELLGICTIFHRVGRNVSENMLSFKANNIEDLSDNVILAKFIINNIAANYGKKVVFNQVNQNNFKLLFNFSNNDYEKFAEHYIVNRELLLEYTQYLQLDNLTGSSVENFSDFNYNYKIQIGLNIKKDFIPYLAFALINLCFVDPEIVASYLQRRDLQEFLNKNT